MLIVLLTVCFFYSCLFVAFVCLYCFCLFLLLTVGRLCLFARIANSLFLCLLHFFDPHHLLDGPAVIFGHVEVYDHVALLMVLMTVAHLALDSLEFLLQLVERKRGVGIGQEVEETVGLDADGRRPNRFSKDDSGQQMAQSRPCFVDVLLLQNIGSNGECNLHVCKSNEKK